MNPAPFYKIADCLISPDRNRLVRRGEEIRLEPKHMQVLLCLIAHCGETVSKDELLAAAWAEVVVTEHSLNQAISKLRQALGDEAKRPRIIETVSKKGYRLIAPVESIAAQHEQRSETPFAENQAAAHFASVSRRSFYFFSALVLVLFSTVAAMMWLNAPASHELTTRLAPLTSLPGLERFPVYSPDKRRLAYVHYNPEAKRANVLKLLDLASNTTVELSETEGAMSFPCFSPDGKRLAFVTMLGCESAVHTIAIEGGEATKLFNGFSDQLKGLDWSPNGRQLVYADRATQGEPFALFLFSLDTQRRTRLTTPEAKNLGDKLPAFSPNAKFIAFARTEANHAADIYLVHIATGEQQRLTHDNAQIAGLDWLADGEHLVYGGSGEAESKLVRVETSTGATQKLISSLEYTGVNLNARGEKIAFESVAYQTGIYKKNLTPNAAPTANAEIFAATTRSNWFPQYSPDGQRLAFLSDRSGAVELWLCDVEGNDPRKVVAAQNISPHSPPRWSPDSRFILCDKKTERSNEIFVLEVETGAAKFLADEATTPFFARNGGEVYFSSRRTGQWQIWKMPLAGGKPARITAGGGYVGEEAQHGGEMYFTKYDQPGIWKRSALGVETQIIAALASQDRANWQLTKEGIYFVNRMLKSDLPVLCFFEFANAETHVVEDFLQKLDNRISGFCLSPNRTILLFSQVERVDIDLVELSDGARPD